LPALKNPPAEPAPHAELALNKEAVLIIPTPIDETHPVEEPANHPPAELIPVDIAVIVTGSHISNKSPQLSLILS